MLTLFIANILSLL